MTISTLSQSLSAFALNWAAAYLVHSTLLLLLAWTCSRLLRDRRVALQETLWRGALFGALLTASLQVGLEPLSLAEAPTRFASREAGLAAGLAPALDAAPLAHRGEETTALREGARGGWALPMWGAGALALAWVAGALFGLARLLDASRRLSAQIRDARSLSGTRLRSFLEALASAMGFSRRIDLLASTRVPAPFAAGLRRPRIVIPSDALERLGEAEQEGLVAHEAAHLARRDPAWLLAARVMERVFFFQPLNRVARCHLQESAELLADEHAALHSGRGDQLARCLVEIAGWRSGLVDAAAVVGAGTSPRSLARRVERLISGRRDGGHALAVPLTLALLVGVALVPSVSCTVSEASPSLWAPQQALVASAESQDESAEPAVAPEPPVAPAEPAAPEPALASGDAPAPQASPAPEPAPGPAPQPPAAPPARELAPTDEGAGFERAAREYRVRVHEMLERERALRLRIEELAARLDEEDDPETRERIADLKSELGSLHATRDDARRRFEEAAREAGPQITARERLRELERSERRARVERQARAAYDEQLRALARAPRAPRRLLVEEQRARLEAEIAQLRARERELARRLEELEREADAQEKNEGATD